MLKYNLIKLSTIILFLFLFCKLLSNNIQNGIEIDVVSQLPILSRDTVSMQISPNAGVKISEIKVYQIEDENKLLLLTKTGNELYRKSSTKINFNNYKYTHKSNVITLLIEYISNKGKESQYLSVPVYNPPAMVLNKLYGKEIYTENILKKVKMSGSGGFLKPISLTENTSKILPKKLENAAKNRIYQDILMQNNTHANSISSVYQDFSKHYIGSLYNGNKSNEGNDNSSFLQASVKHEKTMVIEKMITMAKKISIPKRVDFSYSSDKKKKEEDGLIASL